MRETWQILMARFRQYPNLALLAVFIYRLELGVLGCITFGASRNTWETFGKRSPAFDRDVASVVSADDPHLELRTSVFT